MPHGIDGVKVREQVSTKCLSSGAPVIFFTGAAFSALALDSGINPEWQKRGALLLLRGRWDRKKPVRSFEQSRICDTLFPIHPYRGSTKRNIRLVHTTYQDTFGMVCCRNNTQGQRRIHFSPSLVIPTALFSSRLMRPALSIAVVNTVFLMVGKP